MKKFGLDFGTTNSAISIVDAVSGKARVIPIDELAVDPRVVRSMLYFFPRKLVISEKVPPVRREAEIYYQWELTYEGKQRQLIGQGAVTQYLKDNKNRTAGVKRSIMTGRFLRLGSASTDQARGDEVMERYEEYDFGTGRLMQALKTGLKSRLYKGTTIFGKLYPLEELIGIYLGEIKRAAEKVIGEEITAVRSGRPVHFLDDPERDRETEERLKRGLEEAGFREIEFEFEPVAAAKQFVGQSEDNKKVFVFDFGGGTLDTAIVEGERVLAIDGVYIGGDLLNADLVEKKLWKYFGSEERYGDQQLEIPLHIYEPLKAWFNLANLNNPDMMSKFERLRYQNTNPKTLERYKYLIQMNLGFELYEAVEVAKKSLSNHAEAVISFHHGIIDIEEPISRAEFETIIRERVEEIREVVKRTLASAGLSAGEIDVVVRTGGSSLIPVFERMLIEMFGNEKIQQFETFTSIAAGLAL